MNVLENLKNLTGRLKDEAGRKALKIFAQNLKCMNGDQILALITQASTDTASKLFKDIAKILNSRKPYGIDYEGVILDDIRKEVNNLKETYGVEK